MLDRFGHHADRDPHAELATLNRRIKSLSAQAAHAGTYEDRHNADAELSTLRLRAHLCATEAAEADAAHERLSTAVFATGDPLLAFLAYVALGPVALPIEPRYEVRLIQRLGGYTVPNCVRRHLTADQVDDAKREVFAEALKPSGHARLWEKTGRDYRTLVVAY